MLYVFGNAYTAQTQTPSKANPDGVVTRHAAVCIMPCMQLLVFIFRFHSRKGQRQAKKNKISKYTIFYKICRSYPATSQNSKNAVILTYDSQKCQTIVLRESGITPKCSQFFGNCTRGCLFFQVFFKRRLLFSLFGFFHSH